MFLSEGQLRQFQQQGYTAVPEFFNAREVAALQADIERLLREGHLRNVATDGDGRSRSQTKANLQICPMTPQSTLVRALPFHPRVLETVTALLGDRIVLHLDQCFLKPARHGAGTNWHQDNAYFQVADPMKGTAMWIAVHDATLANGTLQVIPNAVHEKFEHRRDPDSDHHIRCYPPEERALPVELKAGGAVFFAYGTPHKTGGNATAKDRAGVALHFLHQDYATTEEFTNGKDTARKHPLLTGPGATLGVKEYGLKVAGTWEHEVEQALAGREEVKVMRA